MTPETRRIGTEALYWRDRKGVTLRDVTMFTGIPGPNITQFEKTGIGLSDVKREMLARYYGAPQDAFLDPEEDLTDMLDPHSAGALLHADLKARGWRQRQLAEATGIHFTAVYRYITGERPLTPEASVKFARALGTDGAAYAMAQAAWEVRKLLEAEG
jgi:transcriptional regulator with XRE-family HTH domain